MCEAAGLKRRFQISMTWVLNVLEKVPSRHPGERCRDEVVFTVQR